MNMISVPTTIFTIATGSRLGGHCTCIAVSVEQLVQEVNSTLDCDLDMKQHIIEEYNETADTLGRPFCEDSADEFNFQFIVDNDPQMDSCGWGWSRDYFNARGEKDHGYLNISVHHWKNTYFESQG